VLVVAGLVVAVAPLSLLRFAGGKPKRQRA
jgi:hypothetical protein